MLSKKMVFLLKLKYTLKHCGWDKMIAIFAGNIFKCIFLSENLNFK